MNPILIKELRSEMRTFRAPLMISLYAGVIAAVTYGFYHLEILSRASHGFGLARIGSDLFVILSIVQLVLIAFLVPAMTSGAISGERERQTLDLLLCTRLSAPAIVLGKLVSSLAFIIILVVATLPFFAFCLLFGGIEPVSILLTFLVFFVTAVTFGAIGLFASTYIQRTQIATVFTYACVFFLLVGTLAITAFISAVTGWRPNQALPVLIYANPLFGLVSVLPDTLGLTSAFGPLPLRMPPWAINSLVNGSLSILCLVLAVKRLRPTKKGRA